MLCRLLFLILSVGSALFAEDLDRYLAYKKSTLSAQTEVVTVQQAASSGRRIDFD